MARNWAAGKSSVRLGFGLGGEVDELYIGTQYPAVAGEFHAVVELELIAAAGTTEEHIGCAFGQGWLFMPGRTTMLGAVDCVQSGASRRRLG